MAKAHCPQCEAGNKCSSSYLLEFEPYIPGKHPTTHCFFCVTCDMIVPKERASEHEGHEQEH
jgi:hypothetical protein